MTYTPTKILKKIVPGSMKNSFIPVLPKSGRLFSRLPAKRPPAADAVPHRVRLSPAYSKAAIAPESMKTS